MQSGNWAKVQDLRVYDNNKGTVEEKGTHKELSRVIILPWTLLASGFYINKAASSGTLEDCNWGPEGSPYYSVLLLQVSCNSPHLSNLQPLHRQDQAIDPNPHKFAVPALHLCCLDFVWERGAEREGQRTGPATRTDKSLGW